MQSTRRESMPSGITENDDGSILITWNEDIDEEEFVKALASGILTVGNRYDTEGTLAPETIVEPSETQSKEVSSGTV